MQTEGKVTEADDERWLYFVYKGFPGVLELADRFGSDTGTFLGIF